MIHIFTYKNNSNSGYHDITDIEFVNEYTVEELSLKLDGHGFTSIIKSLGIFFYSHDDEIQCIKYVCIDFNKKSDVVYSFNYYYYYDILYSYKREIIIDKILN